MNAYVFQPLPHEAQVTILKKYPKTQKICFALNQLKTIEMNSNAGWEVSDANRDIDRRVRPSRIGWATVDAYVAQ